MTTSALQGITVVDFSQFESGTACTETLAFLGANVIKVERPKVGEQGRTFFTSELTLNSYHFILLNANKKSITVDVKHPEGKALVRKLIEQADVLVENFSPGAIDRLGFDYETVKSINPRMIYAQIKGFGMDGPYANFPAFDPVGQAMGGAASITGEPDGPPMQMGPNIADCGTGFHCAIAILAALYQRSVTGVGQRVEVTMQDAVINFCRPAWGRQFLTGEPTARVGNAMPMAPVAPCGAYKCKPGGMNDYLFIYTSRWANSQQWKHLLRVIGREDLLEEPRFETPESRYEHREEVDAIISAWTTQRDKIEAMEELGRAGVPAGATLSTADLAADPYLRKRGMFVEIDHPVTGPLTMVGSPFKMSASSVPILPAPLLGEHNDLVYKEMLKISDDELERLRQAGVI